MQDTLDYDLAISQQLNLKMHANIGQFVVCNIDKLAKSFNNEPTTIARSNNILAVFGDKVKIASTTKVVKLDEKNVHLEVKKIRGAKRLAPGKGYSYASVVKATIKIPRKKMLEYFVEK